MLMLTCIPEMHDFCNNFVNSPMYIHKHNIDTKYFCFQLSFNFSIEFVPNCWEKTFLFPSYALLFIVKCDS